MVEMSDPLDPASWLTLVAQRAPELRRAGVESISLAGCSIKLAPWSEPLGKPEAATLEGPDDSNPLFDPANYAGGIVPGFVIERELPADGDLEGRQ